MRGLFQLATLMALILPVSASPAGEADGETLATEKRCVACHDLTTTLLGPPYMAIAARHSANRDVMVDVLAYKIIVGGAPVTAEYAELIGADGFAPDASGAVTISESLLGI